MAEAADTPEGHTPEGATVVEDITAVISADITAVPDITTNSTTITTNSTTRQTQ